MTFPEPRPKGQIAKRFREEDRQSKRRRDNASLVLAFIPFAATALFIVALLFSGDMPVIKEGKSLLIDMFWGGMLFGIPLQFIIGMFSIVLAESRTRRWANATISMGSTALAVLIYVHVL